MSPATDEPRLVAKFYALQATRSTGFVSPIFALFVLRDVSFAEYGVLSAVLSVVMVGGEVPTGYVGDRYGRKASLALSVGCTVVSLLGFVVARGFVPYLAFYVIWAFALTFASGSVDAWLYELLAEHLSADAYTTIRGRGASVMHWTSVATMIGGGALYVVDPTYPFLASAALNALGLIVLRSMPESSRVAGRPSDGDAGGPSDSDAGEPSDDDTGEPSDSDAGGSDRVGPREAFRVVRRDFAAPPLRWLALYAGLFFAVVSAATSYVQPVTEEAVRAGLDAAAADLLGAALPLGLLLGLLYASFTAVSAVAGYYAGDVEARFGLPRSLLVVPLLTGGLLLAPRFVPLLALPMFVALRGSWALLFPMVSGRLNDGLESAGRATALSAFSMLYQLAKVPLVLAAGVVADGAGATAATALLGGTFLVAAAVAWLVGGPTAASSVADAT